MSDWPELERRLLGSAKQRADRRWRTWSRLALVPVAGALIAVALVLVLRAPASDERSIVPADERAVEEPTGPGRHGTALTSAAYGDTTLDPGTANRLSYVEGQPFVVVLTNEGENDERDVDVSVRIRPVNGEAITLEQRVASIAKGERATASLALSRQPPIAQALTVEVEVAKVPGELTRDPKDNNRISYPALFTDGTHTAPPRTDTNLGADHQTSSSALREHLERADSGYLAGADWSTARSFAIPGTRLRGWTFATREKRCLALPDPLVEGYGVSCKTPQEIADGQASVIFTPPADSDAPNIVGVLVADGQRASIDPPPGTTANWESWSDLAVGTAPSGSRLVVAGRRIAIEAPGDAG